MANARKSPAKPAAAKPAAAAKSAVVEAAPLATTPASQDPATLVRESADSALANTRAAQEQFRKAAEEGLEKAREAYARMKAEAEAAASSVETSLSTAREGLNTLNTKAFDAVKLQSQAGFEHARALLAAKGPQDIFTLQGEFVRKQLETFAAQVKDMTSQIQTIAKQSMEPLQAVAGKRFAA